MFQALAVGMHMSIYVFILSPGSCTFLKKRGHDFCLSSVLKENESV